MLHAIYLIMISGMHALVYSGSLWSLWGFFFGVCDLCVHMLFVDKETSLHCIHTITSFLIKSQ